MKKQLQTTATNVALENEVREYLSMGEEVRADYLATILGLLEPGTWVSSTHVVELSKGITASSSMYVKEDVEIDWVKMCKNPNFIKVSINRKGRNNLCFSREKRRFKVTAM